MLWGIEKCAGFENQYKKFSRKHENEASAALSNLESYFQVLQVTNNVQVANQQPFVHSEPDGIVAIDQRGASTERSRGKLKATRLYVYAAVIQQTLYLLGIGDKDSQKQDLETCRNKVKRINKG